MVEMHLINELKQILFYVQVEPIGLLECGGYNSCNNTKMIINTDYNGE